MGQTKAGASKSAAKLRGMTPEEYQARVDAGEKWCTKGKHWAPRSTFGVDTHRADGLATDCLACRRVPVRKNMKGRVSTFRGHTHTDEAKRAMSVAHKGKANERKGIPRSIAERARISAALRASPRVARGERCHMYKDGKVAERRDLRFSTEYKRWRYDVFMRDAFTCQSCGDARGGNLNAHHIKPFADFPDLRFELSNGITLCQTCHDNLHDKPNSTRKLRRARRAARQ